MKLRLFFFLSAALVLSGCVKDRCKSTYTFTMYQPVYMGWDEFRNSVETQPAHAIKNTGKIYYYDHFIFLNEVNKGIHIINNANPSLPVNIGFINIPGNIDMAIKNNVLYADSYIDLVAVDLTDLMHVTLKKRIQEIFPHRVYDLGYTDDPAKGVIVDWVQKDTMITEDCRSNYYGRGGGVYASGSGGPMYMKGSSSTTPATGGGGSPQSAPGNGIGGSMARFTITGNYLYCVSNTDLQVVNITDVQNPQKGNTVSIGMNIETIFPVENQLFIGSSSGVFIYDVNNPVMPVRIGSFGHVRSCDPVVVENDIAYVTLRSGTTCQGFTNQLDVLDVKDITNPVLIKSYPMNNPHGLGIDGGKLVICDGAAGLKFFEASNAQDIILKNTAPGMSTYDVIMLGTKLVMVAEDGLYQYDYSDISNPVFISKINLTK